MVFADVAPSLHQPFPPFFRTQSPFDLDDLNFVLVVFVVYPIVEYLIFIHLRFLPSNSSWSTTLLSTLTFPERV